MEFKYVLMFVAFIITVYVAGMVTLAAMGKI